MMRYLIYVILAILAILFIYTIYDVIRILKIKTKSALPIQDGKNLKYVGLAKLIEYFEYPEKVPKDITLDSDYIIKELQDCIEYINCRYDCSDFVGNLLFRFYKDNKQKLPDEVKSLIKTTFLNFKYWLDMPEDESMCFFSENHTVLFATLEFLVGQEWENQKFSNSNLYGVQHKQRAENRLYDWFDQRYKFGFFEWYSGNYWNEDIGALMQLCSYSKNIKIKENANKVLNLMWFEVVTHSANGRFITVSSRQYGDNKFINKLGNRLFPAMDYMLNNNNSYDPIEHCKIAQQDMCMTVCSLMALRHKDYILPTIIKDIAMDIKEQIIKTSNGLNPDEYKKLGLIGQSDYQMTAQLSNEIFVNKGFAQNTYKIHKNNNTFASAFSFPIKFVDIFPIRTLKLFPLFCNIIGKKFSPTGSSLNRGNVYTYKKKNYMLATACNCKVYFCGNQHHIMHANSFFTIAIRVVFY